MAAAGLTRGLLGAAATGPPRAVQKPLESQARRAPGRAGPPGGWSSRIAASGSWEAAGDYKFRHAPRRRAGYEPRSGGVFCTQRLGGCRKCTWPRPGTAGPSRKLPGDPDPAFWPTGWSQARAHPFLGLLQGRRGHPLVRRGLESEPEAALIRHPGLWASYSTCGITRLPDRVYRAENHE